MFLLEDQIRSLFFIAVDNIKNVTYNEDVEFLRIVDFLSSNTLKELRIKAEKWKEDIFVRKVMDYVDEYMSDDSNDNFGSQLNFQTKKAKVRGRKAGIKAGKKAGVKIGMKVGAKAEKIETAKRMLLKGIDLDETSELTGLSIKVLENLQKKEGLESVKKIV